MAQGDIKTASLCENIVLVLSRIFLRSGEFHLARVLFSCVVVVVTFFMVTDHTSTVHYTDVRTVIHHTGLDWNALEGVPVLSNECWY